MRRREVIGGIVCGAVGPIAARAQQRPRRIGVLMGWSENDPAARDYAAPFLRRLGELGFGGERSVLHVRWSAGNAERLGTIAREIVAQRPDVILTGTTPALAALLRETHTIPIVFAVVSDPVGDGFVASLARPGGNVTGFINNEASLAGKWIELLKEIDPSIRRAAMLFNPATAPGGGTYFAEPFRQASVALGVDGQLAPITSAGEVDDVVRTHARGPGSGIVVMMDSSTFNWRGVILDAVGRHAVPAVFPAAQWVRDGGLAAYGIDNRDLFRRAAEYVVRILGGTKPADLPVQLPTRFEMAINLKTAKALGIEVPPMLIGRADEVIE